MTSFSWVNNQESPIRLRNFLRHHGISRTLLKQIKFEGGKIVVNDEIQKVNYMLSDKDVVKITLPPEPANDVIQVSDKEITIVYEDENFLVVDKPPHVACLPSHLYKNDTIANRVKGYFIRQGYSNQKIHIVNRLDMDTSGIVIFAKHHFAHSLLDMQMQHHEISKKYIAIVEGKINHQHVDICLPIGRKEGSFIERSVVDGGKPSWTEFWVDKSSEDLTLLKIKLHSGRTHQIRVHFKEINHPLIGDWLYNPDNKLMDRQALHCYEMKFYNPFSQEEVLCQSQIPQDMQQIIKRF